MSTEKGLIKTSIILLFAMLYVIGCKDSSDRRPILNLNNYELINEEIIITMYGKPDSIGCKVLPLGKVTVDEYMRYIYYPFGKIGFHSNDCISSEYLLHKNSTLQKDSNHLY